MLRAGVVAQPRPLGRQRRSSRQQGFPHREIAVPRAASRRMSAKRGEWTAVRYEDREPRRGEERSDEYHAARLFPTYNQFSRTRTGATMVDTFGREYQVADGIDRLEDQDQGLVAPGSPYLVEPSLIEETMGGRAIVFSDLGRTTSSYTFPLLDDDPTSKELAPGSASYPVSRGPQLLYVRIPISVRKKDPAMGLPVVSERLQLYHVATETKAQGTVTEVDGLQFPRTATGSVRLDDLTFLIDVGRLML